MIRILFIGDIVGKPGRDLVHRAVPALVSHRAVDLVVANVENAAGGFGLTPEIGESILRDGVQVMTSGNHIWDKKEVVPYIEREGRLLRPANYPAGAPGRGACVVSASNGVRVGIVNAMGRVFMAALDDPFSAVTREIDVISTETRVILVDFHAEATSEKIAMAWHLDGKATAVVGTHTHVQTADARILPQGTASITDVGMTGPHDSVIGVEKDAAISRFITGLPSKFETATGDPRLNAVLIDADETTGRATAIEPVSISAADIHRLSSHRREQADESTPAGLGR